MNHCLTKEEIKFYHTILCSMYPAVEPELLLETVVMFGQWPGITRKIIEDLIGFADARLYT